MAFAFIAGSLVFTLAGVSARDSYRTMVSGSLGSTHAIANTLVVSTAIVLTGLGVVLARRAGLWNLGGEGQLLVGAISATAVARWFPELPRLILVPAILAAGALGGAAWALGPALLKVRLKVSEALTTLLLNLVAIVLLAWLVNGPWRDPLALGFPVSQELSPSSALPALLRTPLHAGFLLALAAVFILQLVPWPASRNRTSAKNGNGSFPSGPRWSWPLLVLLVMLAAGALGGIAGTGQVSSVTHRLGTHISASYGYIGLFTAVLAGFSPIGVLVLSVPIGALLVGGFALRNVGTSPGIVTIAQITMVAIVLAAEVFLRFRFRWAAGREPRPASAEPGS